LEENECLAPGEYFPRFWKRDRGALRQDPDFRQAFHREIRGDRSRNHHFRLRHRNQSIGDWSPDLMIH
jgi:hypothetical protein